MRNPFDLVVGGAKNLFDVVSQSNQTTPPHYT